MKPVTVASVSMDAGLVVSATSRTRSDAPGANRSNGHDTNDFECYRGYSQRHASLCWWGVVRVIETPEGSEGTDERQLLPDCPRCGTPVSKVTSRGPMERFASPCGCPLAPGALESGSEST